DQDQDQKPAIWPQPEIRFTTGYTAEPRCRPTDCKHWKQICTRLQLLHATWRLRLPPPEKECRLALENFRCRCQGVGGTRIAPMHIFS
ncbi:hypothetical protein B7H18_31145, partial [Pseudomonas putida]